MAILMLPMMVAPALVGLMYRLILHEFVGVVPYYLYLLLGDSPSFLGAGDRVLHPGDGRDPAVDAVRAPDPLHGLCGDPAANPRGGGASTAPARGHRCRYIELPLMVPTHRHRLLHPLHRRLPRLRQRLHADRRRRRRQHHDDDHLHLRGLLPARRRSASRSRPRCCSSSPPSCCCWLINRLSEPREARMIVDRAALAGVRASPRSLMNFPVIVDARSPRSRARRRSPANPASASSAPTLENYIGDLRDDRPLRHPPLPLQQPRRSS